MLSAVLLILGIIGTVQIFRGKAEPRDRPGGRDVDPGEVPETVRPGRDPFVAGPGGPRRGDAAGSGGGEHPPHQTAVGDRPRKRRMVADPVLKLLRGNPCRGNPFAVESVSEIGPAIGHKLRQDATLALLISALAIIIYLAWRFEFKFGVTAAIATFHDIFAMVGIFWVLGIETGPSLHHGAAHHRRVLADRHGGRLRPDPGEHPAPEEGDLLRDDQPERQRGPEPLPRDLDHAAASPCWRCCSSAGTCCTTSRSRS